MNVSIQDGFNLGWKLGSVLTGRAPASLLSTYTAERRPVAQQLIDFDREWSSLMARKPEEISDPEDLATYYLATAEFPSGFMTQYEPGTGVIAADARQELATGFPLGKRFKSAPVTLVADGNVVHLGHHARADGRWRVYVFAGADGVGEGSAAAEIGEWLASTGGPVARFTPVDADVDAVFDVKLVAQQAYDEIDVTRVPEIFRPRTGPLRLMDWEKVFSAAATRWNDVDIFAERGISRDGAIVVVRPDQYVAHILPLEGAETRASLEAFLGTWMLPQA